MLEFAFNSAILLLSFYLLARTVDLFFIESLELISKKLKLSSDVAGATFMALGSSAPELFISGFALLRITASEQAVGAGTIVGSAIFNILVIVGASVLVRRATLTWQPVVRDLGFYVVTILLLLFTFSDGTITAVDSAVFVGVYVLYLFSFSTFKKLLPYDADLQDDVIEAAQSEQKKIKEDLTNPLNLIDKILSLFFFDLKKRKNLFLVNFLIAVLFLAGVSHIMVESAVEAAHFLNIPEVIIGLTILAAGTSVPDLLSSLAVAKRGKGDMAVANAVGSNIFDINVGLGLPWLIYTIFTGNAVEVVTENLTSSIFLLFATVVALIFLLVSRKWEIGRYAGALLIAGYFFYLLTQAGIITMDICFNLGTSVCVSL